MCECISFNFRCIQFINIAASNLIQKIRRPVVLGVILSNISSFLKVTRSFVFKVRNKMAGSYHLWWRQKRLAIRRPNNNKKHEFEGNINHPTRMSMRAVTKQMNVVLGFVSNESYVSLPHFFMLVSKHSWYYVPCDAYCIQLLSRCHFINLLLL